MPSPLLLLVEDDPAIAHTASYALEREGLKVRHVMLVGDARALLVGNGAHYAAVIVDIGLPDGSGLDLCRDLRRDSTVPILILSARAEEMDRVLGLELGADDYLCKPFSPRELCARVRSLLRRSSMVQQPPRQAAALFEHDEPGCRIRAGELWLNLTRREYGLLATLLRRPGQVWSREALLNVVWGQGSESVDRTVDTHIKTLRAKLRDVLPGHELIVTHRGMGYSLDLPQQGGQR